MTNSFIFIVMLGGYDLRDLTQERIKYPALQGQHPSRYPVPRVLLQTHIEDHPYPRYCITIL